MAECKYCGSRYHACIGCGLWFNWEWDYCCEEHWNSSEERAQLLKDHADKFNWTTEQKFAYIKQADTDPDMNNQDNLLFELGKSRKET